MTENSEVSTGFAGLLGKTLSRIEGGEVCSERIRLVTTDGAICVLCHSQDCCETVEVEEIIGDLDDLIGSPLLLAEEVEGGNDEPLEGLTPTGYESWTWTFYKLATVKGYVTLRWLGSSNGYYSEKVSVYWDKAA